MKMASPKLETAHLNANSESLRRCKIALEQKDRGDYAAAQDALLLVDRPILRHIAIGTIQDRRDIPRG